MNRLIYRPLPLPPTPTVTRLAIVGDIHDCWSGNDVTALRAIHPDLTLFVGDIGNEAVDLVKEIASIDVPKVVVLGNHDAFFTSRPKVRATLDRSKGIDKVNQQLDALGDDHIGFGSRSLMNKAVSIIGARPFSSGGRMSKTRLIENIYGHHGVEACSNVIVQNALSAPRDHTLVIMGHNGPSGLGSRRYDICGVDFRTEEGDHGDADLALALAKLNQRGRSPALVTFGHMHHRLKPFEGAIEQRKRLVFQSLTQTLFLNTAVVRRVRTTSQHVQQHHFCLVEIENAKVTKAEDVYVQTVNGKVSPELRVDVLFERVYVDEAETVRVLNTYSGQWEEHEIVEQGTPSVPSNDLALSSLSD